MFEYGSEILKIDFHLHTHKDKEFSYNGADFISDYVNALSEKKIQIGVITNHNKFDIGEYKAMKKAALKKDIFILPGVELSVKEGSNGVHTLIVFNPDEWLTNGEDNISKFLSSVFIGISNSENENTRCNKDLAGTLQAVDVFGGDYFIIFAHIEQSSGFLKECSGGLIASLAKTPEFKNRVLGFQKLRTFDNIGKLKSWMGYSLAFVEGSDPKTIEEIGKGQKETYIKIGDFSFAAIKYALVDFQNRVFEAPEPCHHGYVESIICTGGKLDGTKIYFSKQLNTLIGIRGSGKSSVLEILRYGLNLPSSTDPEYKEALVKNVLGSGGQIALSIFDKYGKQYEVRRILGENPSILDNTGLDLSIPISSIINNPLYFGQKDLSLTKAGYELDLLNKLVGNKIGEPTELLQQHISSLTKAIRLLLDVTNIPDKISDLESKNKDLEHKLKIFSEKGVDEKLKKQTSCNTDALKLAAMITKISDILSALQAAYTKDDTSEISLSSYSSEFNASIFSSASKIVDDIVSLLNSMSDTIEQVALKKDELKSVKKDLSDKIDSLKEEFAEIKREINDDTIDLDSFVKYSKDRDTNLTEIGQLKKTLSAKDSIILEIKKAIRQRNEVLKSIFKAYSAEIASINASQSELSIYIEFKGDKAQFKNDIKTAFKGTGISDTKYQVICDCFSDFVAVIEDYFVNSGIELHKILTDNEFSKFSEKVIDSYSELISLTCPNLVNISYHGKLLSKHSIGQRASALVLFILTQQDNDIIIIDQPEDDLDNQVIYKELIQTIKAKKPNIQFIFATHNANIPVLGDAENIITTEYSEDQIKVAEGTIDSPSTHDKIVDIMEGGIEAFQKRNRIYTSWK